MSVSSLRLAPVLLTIAIAGFAADLPKESVPVRAEIFEDLPKEAWLAPVGEPTSVYSEAAFAPIEIPTRYSPNALPADRSEPFTYRATMTARLPAGEYRFRLRSKGLANFALDGETLASTHALKPNTASHDALPEAPAPDPTGARPPQPPHQDVFAAVQLDGGEHTFTLTAVIGGKGLAPFPGELSLSYAPPGQVDRVLGGPNAPLLVDGDWERYAEVARARHLREDIERRRASDEAVEAAWGARHEKIRAWLATRPAPVVPEAEGRTAIDRFLGARLAAAGMETRPLLGDLELLRRLSLDTIGLTPEPALVEGYLAQPEASRREWAIRRLVNDPGWADHWIPYWQDVLAENPGILKPDLNNTGPFRWYLHQAFLDGYPFDRLVVELLEMEGSLHKGAPAGFAMASLNDAPLAAKADILSQAFLGNRLSCARCHDAPFHPFKQRDLFSISAMLAGKPVTLPETSTVPVREGGRKPYVEITLKPGDAIDPHWPFENLTEDLIVAPPPKNTDVESRYALAAMVVSPANKRFAEVAVNRLWQRYMGRGLVESADDWSQAKPSHPELLDYLSREFVASGYDLKALARLIFRSDAYQRAPVAEDPGAPSDAAKLFAGPTRRYMTAEQLVDSLHHIAGKGLDSEELNLNPLGDRPLRQFLNMGEPERAWEMTALSNERDRPSLALPRAQAVVDLLSAYGWRQSRQSPQTDRDDGPSPMQTLALANGSTGTRGVRLSDDSFFTRLALEDRPLDEMIEGVFVRALTRQPTADEKAMMVEYLAPYFDDRVVPLTDDGAPRHEKKTDTRVSWANHFDAQSTLIRMEEERMVRMGDPPTERLKPEFRERFEDVVWALVNSTEFTVIP
jgi:hypothetical protein